MIKRDPARVILLLVLGVGLVLGCSGTALADTVVNAFPSDPLADIGQFLTNDVVRTILLTVGIAGVVIEILTVGSFGLFGAVGIAGFVLYFMGSLWTGNLSSAVIGLLIGGLVLLAIEILVTPGFGIPGILGILAIFISLVMASERPAAAAWSLLIALVASGLIIYYTLKNRKTRNVWKKLILRQKLDGESGFHSVDTSLSSLQGQRGMALSVLRPAGVAEFSGQKTDVVTQGEFIEAGRQVEVILVEGMRVVVKEV